MSGHSVGHRHSRAHTDVVGVGGVACPPGTSADRAYMQWTLYSEDGQSVSRKTIPFVATATEFVFLFEDFAAVEGENAADLTDLRAVKLTIGPTDEV